jgi:hypothetical protein
LADANQALVPLASQLAVTVTSVLDLNGDGHLDLAGLADGQPAQLTGAGTRGYHFQIVRPRALTASGDQRINTFGIGGIVEVRAGSLVQTQVITGPVVHVGLGTSTAIDVARIVWPNGVPQAEFDPAVDAAITAEQRLKGSCPWIFADDGTGLKFVTDFLWRSPLGLRINAQDTAGVTQTEDWVKIRGDQLAPRNGAYDIRISAELWETHFIDHVSLMVVDHRDDVEVFVDERFAPGAPPALKVHATKPPTNWVDLPDRQQHQRGHRPGRTRHPNQPDPRGANGVWPVDAGVRWLGIPSGQAQDRADRPAPCRRRRSTRRTAAAPADEPRDLLGLDRDRHQCRGRGGADVATGAGGGGSAIPRLLPDECRPPRSA